MYIEKTRSERGDIIHSYKCSHCDAVLGKRVQGYDGIDISGYVTEGKLDFCPKCGEAIVDIFSISPSHKLFTSDTPTTIENCPTGLFMCGEELCMKTEYHDLVGDTYRPMAYIVSTGERFCAYDKEIFPVATTIIDI